MKCSDDGIALIKEYEGLRLHAYQDAVGIWTIGYGHTGYDVDLGRLIDEAEADRLLREDLTDAETCISEHAHGPLTQGQFDALCSFVFNLGCKAFAGSTLLQLINAGDMEAAAPQFLRWDKAAGKRLSGLTRRREAERDRFVA